jgi:AcrR family transcriptional regulator
VPAATVHHYLKLGLLPPPERASRNRFLYGEAHVRALRLIRTLRERRGLSLPVIRTILPDLLGLEREQAFRPEMWDRAVVLHAGRGRRAPGERLLDAAVDAFSRRGYGDVNVDDICKAARIAKGSFYRHYRSKEELFFAAAEAAANEVAESFGRAMASGPVPLERAPEVLAPLIERRVPVFMDLFTRAIQRRPGYPGTARRVFSSLAVELGRQLEASDPLMAGARTLQMAAARLFQQALEPSPLGSLGVVPAEA